MIKPILKKIAIGLFFAYAGLLSMAYADSIHNVLLKKMATVIAFSAFICFIAIPISHIMFSKVTDFHKKYNSANLHKNPVRFAIENETKIHRGIDIFLVCLICYVVIGVVFSKNF